MFCKPIAPVFTERYLAIESLVKHLTAPRMNILIVSPLSSRLYIWKFKHRTLLNYENSDK